MNIKALGIYGNQLKNHKTTTFLINNTLLIDAGAITSTLSIKEQAAINNIILTHSHADHIKDIAFLADNVIGRKPTAIKIYGSKELIENLKKHYLNDKIWPDFTIIPSSNSPVFQYEEISEGEKFKTCNLTIEAVRTNHPVFTTGLIVSNGKNTFALSSDTGPTEDFWKKLNNYKKIDTLFVETSFPNNMKELALLSGHLTPELLQEELKKFKHLGDTDIYVFHLKPAFEPKLKRELLKLDIPKLHILKQGQELKI